MEGAWRPPTYATVCVMSFAILPVICIYVYIGWMYLSICPTTPDVIDPAIPLTKSVLILSASRIIITSIIIQKSASTMCQALCSAL